MRETGRLGERDAGVDPNKPKERVESRTGTAKYRVPDESDKTSIKETKNVKELKITDQIKDFVAEAKESARELTVKIRESTKIGPSAEKYVGENGVKIQRIGMRQVTIPSTGPVVEGMPVEMPVRVPVEMPIVEPIIIP
ncbi:MAG: putative toxin [Gammaproteobacteria bacterium]